MNALDLALGLILIKPRGVEGDRRHLDWRMCTVRPSPAGQSFHGGHQLRQWRERNLRQSIDGRLASPMHQQEIGGLNPPKQGERGC